MSKRGWYLVGMLVLLFLANVAMLLGLTNWPQRTREGFADAVMARPLALAPAKKTEGFMDMLVDGFATAPIGAYDGLNLAAGLPPEAQGFRQKHPNDPLEGPPIQVDADHLFIFANNRQSPECCSATLSSSGGCVCTTPEQRTLINTRGGNRVHGGDF